MAWFFFTCTEIRLNAAHVSIRVLNCSFFALSLSDSTERKWWEPCKLLWACSNNTGLFPKIRKSLSTAYSSFFTSTCLSSAQYASHCQSQGRASVSLSRTGSPLFLRPLLHPRLLVILITTVRGRGKSHSTADSEKERREAHKAAAEHSWWTFTVHRPVCVYVRVCWHDFPGLSGWWSA